MAMRLHAEPLIVDNFAGGGGASLGIEMALGRGPDLAVNHDEEAVALHAENHPETRHFCESVWRVDPVNACMGRPVGLAWFSPDCTHFSKAKGGKPRSKKIRGLAWVVVRWAKAVRPAVIVLENVEEFATWGPVLPDGKPCPARRGRTFCAWRRKLERLGYVVQHRELRACDYGAPTIRKRLFVIARCDEQPIIWPEPTHGPGRPLPYRTAADCIDWSIPCPSIFERSKPLVEKTQARIARGIVRFVIDNPEPFIVLVSPGGDHRVHSIREPVRTVTGAHRGEFALCAPYITPYYGGESGERRGAAVDAPLPTVTTARRHALVAPTLVQTGYGERPGQEPRALDLHETLGTVVGCGIKHALVSSFLAKRFGGNETPGSRLDEPMHTVTARDHHALVASSLVKLHGSCRDGQPVTEPMPTVHAQGTHVAEVRAFLTKYYGRCVGQKLDDPAHTITGKPRFGLVTVAGEDYAIADIGMRMLVPRELYRAQGFPDSYRIDVELRGKRLTKEAQIRMVGNSVCPPLAAAIIRANCAHLAVERPAARQALKRRRRAA